MHALVDESQSLILSRTTKLHYNSMKCIVLAGGSSIRLNPISKGISKLLMPIYGKPIVYYTTSLLILAALLVFTSVLTRWWMWQE